MTFKSPSLFITNPPLTARIFGKRSVVRDGGIVLRALKYKGIIYVIDFSIDGENFPNRSNKPARTTK